MLEVGVTAQILTGPKVPADGRPRAHLGEKTIWMPGSAAYEAAVAAPLPPVLSYVENRAHFAMWTLLSSPLTLSLNFSNTAVVDSVWDIITNTEMIAVDQAWAGSIGGLIAEANTTVLLEHCAWIWAGDPNCTLPIWQTMYKPLPNGTAAVLVMNHAFVNVSTAVEFSNIPTLACAPGPCAVRDIIAHQDLGSFTGSVPVDDLVSHDVRYFVISSPAANAGGGV